jgi:hypothetical protein
MRGKIPAKLGVLLAKLLDALQQRNGAARGEAGCRGQTKSEFICILFVVLRVGVLEVCHAFLAQKLVWFYEQAVVPLPGM